MLEEAEELRRRVPEEAEELRRRLRLGRGERDDWGEEGEEREELELRRLRFLDLLREGFAFALAATLSSRLLSLSNFSAWLEEKRMNQAECNRFRHGFAWGCAQHSAESCRKSCQIPRFEPIFDTILPATMSKPPMLPGPSTGKIVSKIVLNPAFWNDFGHDFPGRR